MHVRLGLASTPGVASPLLKSVAVSPPRPISFASNMAPFGQALKVRPSARKGDCSSSTSKSEPVNGDGGFYAGDVDPEWCIGSIANGGYVLALIVEACIQFQSTKAHIDLLHVTAHYVRTTATAPFDVCIRVVKIGAGFTNLTADLMQDGVVRLMTHLIFGTNEPGPNDNPSLVLNPPSPYARRLPLYTHPSEAKTKGVHSAMMFHKWMKWTEEKEILDKNNLDSPTRTTSSTIGGGGLEWGTWFEFTNKDEKITTPSLAFLVDIFSNTPSLLPQSERGGLGSSWFPTMTLAIEFKNKIKESPKHADRTVGIYSRGNFMNSPQGRHEAYCEVWTAPSNIGEGSPTANWRDEQVCLAIATQMALVVPMELNVRKGKWSRL